MPPSSLQKGVAPQRTAEGQGAEIAVADMSDVERVAPGALPVPPTYYLERASAFCIEGHTGRHNFLNRFAAIRWRARQDSNLRHSA